MYGLCLVCLFLVALVEGMSYNIRGQCYLAQQCPPGSFNNITQCTPCPSGYFCQGGSLPYWHLFKYDWSSKLLKMSPWQLCKLNWSYNLYTMPVKLLCKLLWSYELHTMSYYR